VTQSPGFRARELVPVPLDRTGRLTYLARVSLQIVLNPNPSRSVVTRVALRLVLVPARRGSSVAIVTLVLLLLLVVIIIISITIIIRRGLPPPPPRGDVPFLVVRRAAQRVRRRPRFLRNELYPPHVPTSFSIHITLFQNARRYRMVITRGKRRRRRR